MAEVAALIFQEGVQGETFPPGSTETFSGILFSEEVFLLHLVLAGSRFCRRHQVVIAAFVLGWGIVISRPKLEF